MSSVRALTERVRRLEQARVLPKSPLELAFGSFDAYADAVHQGVEAGQLDRRDMLGLDGNGGVLRILRSWHDQQLWGTLWRRNRIWEYGG
jgi:hypothetical protein